MPAATALGRVPAPSHQASRLVAGAPHTSATVGSPALAEVRGRPRPSLEAPAARAGSRPPLIEPVEMPPAGAPRCVPAPPHQASRLVAGAPHTSATVDRPTDGG